MPSEDQQDRILAYVLGEMSDAERVAFERELAVDAELAAEVVATERAVGFGLLSGTPVAEPPPELKRAVMVIADQPPNAPKVLEVPEQPRGNVIGWAGWLGWGVAAALAIVVGTQVERLSERAAALNEALEAAQDQVVSSRVRLEEVMLALAEASDTREQLQTRIAELTEARALDRLQIAALTSELAEAYAGFAVFDRESDEGIIEVLNLPQLDAGEQDYQLWVVDPQYPNPVDAGVFQVDEQGRARIRFHATQPVENVAAFAVSLERSGGVPVAEGPMVLVGAL